MNYRYTFRDSTGSRKFGTIEASNRSEAFAILKTDGITPISLTEDDGSGQHIQSYSKLLKLAVIIVAVVICGALIAALWPKAAPAKRSSAAAAKKSVAEKAAAPIAAPAAKQSADKTNAVSRRTYRDERGILRYEGGARAPDPTRKVNVITNRLARASALPKFSNSAETELAAILSIEPGRQRFGTKRYDDRFVAAFEAALTNKIVITAADTEYEAEMKRAVIELKADLANRMADGEDLKVIMQENQEEMQRLAKLRRSMEQDLNETLKNTDLTDKDVHDYFAAANKILAEKGIAPFTDSAMMRASFRLHRIKEKGIK